MYTPKKILVPTDFSLHSVDALHHAVKFAGMFAAEITLLHVDEFSVSPMGANKINDEAVVQYTNRKTAFFAERFDLMLRGVVQEKLTVVPRILGGRSYKVIVETAENEGFDLVVIATRGLTELSSYLIGSTAERVVRLSRQPVLSVQGPPRQGVTFSSILCSTDLSPSANNALTYALSLARQYSAKLFIQYTSELEKPEEECEIRKRLPDLKNFHHRADEVEVEYLFDRDVEPSNSIIRIADDRDVGLIVMSTHGRKGLRRVYIGNNTAEVVRQSTRPVLTVTHPLHKVVFSRPVTEKTVSGITPSQ